MDSLQSNALGALLRTLGDLADVERQRAYKNAVPFVDVPAELLQQWSAHSHLLRNANWFRELFTLEETNALMEFGHLVDAKLPPDGPRLADVPEICTNPVWAEVMMGAAVLLARLGGPRGGSEASRTATTDFSHVLSREAAEQLVLSGDLEAMMLLPPLFGGSADPRNISFVPPGTSEAKAIIDRTIEGLAEAELVTNYRAAPEYRDRCIVPRRVRISAWSDGRVGRFEGVVEIW